MELGKTIEPAAHEARIYDLWERSGGFQPRAPGPLTRGPFAIMIPPPNVTGVLHMGHALNNTIQDIVIRHRRMQGFEALWLPGTDHAGIATQAVVERRLFEVYAEESGRPLGDGIGVLRDVIVADTDEEAQALWASSGTFCGAAWFAPFGFSQGLVDPATGEMPDLLGESLALVGSADTVARQLERLAARLPLRWLFAWTYNGLVAHEKLMRSIELFGTVVAPAVRRAVGTAATTA